MARARMLNPNIWDDPSFCELSIQARLLYIGLISNADDEGYLRGHIGSIKRLVFGMDDLTSDATQLLITEITSHLPSVHAYKADDGQSYIHLSNWFKYQHQQKDRIVPSLFPKCSVCVANDNQALTEVKLSRLSKEKLSSVGEVGESLQPAAAAFDFKSAKERVFGGAKK